MPRRPARRAGAACARAAAHTAARPAPATHARPPRTQTHGPARAAPGPPPTRNDDHACNVCGFVCRYRTTYSAVSRIYGVLTNNATQWYPKHCINTFLYSLPIFYFFIVDRLVAWTRHSVTRSCYVRVEIVAVTVCHVSPHSLGRTRTLVRSMQVA